MKKHALIVAGGSGSRMNTALPKQFLLLNNRPIIMHTIDRFTLFDPSIEIVVVLPETQFAYWKELCEKYQFKTPHQLIAGGKNRFDSVNNGLSSIINDGIVAIHDGVRPLVSFETIERCFSCAEENGNALPVLPVVESLRQIKSEGSRAADRSQFVTVQTPQVFRVDEIKKAYALGFDPTFTDDTMVLERLGTKINLVEGNFENIKITHSTDLIIAKALLENSGL